MEPDERFYCAEFQPPTIGGQLMPYMCTEPEGHSGDHRAVIDGRQVARWPQRRRGGGAGSVPG